MTKHRRNRLPWNGVRMMNDQRIPGEFMALRQQVEGLSGDYDDLKSVVVGLDRKFEAGSREMDRKLETGLAGVSTRLDNAVAQIFAKLDARSEPKYGLLISLGTLIVLVVSSIGALAYWPMSTGMTRLEHMMELQQQNLVPRLELQGRLKVMTDQNMRQDDSLQKLRTHLDSVVATMNYMRGKMDAMKEMQNHETRSTDHPAMPHASGGG